MTEATTNKHQHTLIKSAVMAICESVLPTSLLTRVRFTLYGKWGDQLDGVTLIRQANGDRAQITGLMRVLFLRSTKVKEVLVHPTENSVFERPGSDLIPRYMAGGRLRLATCSGVSWFDDRHLAVVNFHGRHARIYYLHGDLGEGNDLRLQLLHHQDHPFAPPEDVAVTPDRRLMAVTHAPPGDTMVTLHELDSSNLRPGPVKQRLRRATANHGVTFSPDSRFLFFTEVWTGAVQVYDVGRLPAKRTHSFIVPIAPRVPKAVSVTPDGRYVAVMHAAEVSLGCEHLTGSRIAIHRFDTKAGKIEKDPVVVREGSATGLTGIESGSFLRGSEGGPYLLSICEQGADLVTLFRFDPSDSRLEPVSWFGDVSFPHGIDGNPSGTLMAVACYGDDTLRLYKLPTDEDLLTRDNRPHILICVTASNDDCDAEHDQFTNLARLLTQQGYRITCLVSDEVADASLESCCDCIIRLDFPAASPECPYDEHNAARLETFLSEEYIDVVQVHGVEGWAAMEAAKRTGIPTIACLSNETRDKPMADDSSQKQVLLASLLELADFHLDASSSEDDFNVEDRVIDFYRTIFKETTESAKQTNVSLDA